MSLPLSILDLVTVSQGSTARAAMEASLAAARLADELGYRRLWFAEHHNTPDLGASATAVLIARVAAATSRIRVGSGGVMLPNHSPLMVAETYGSLANLYEGRIDLGVGRASGTDGRTAAALSRGSDTPEDIAATIEDLQSWFGPTGRGAHTRVRAVVAQGTEVPIWVLGASDNGARIAGSLGLPFAVASHFAPDQAVEAVNAYRASFRADVPTARLEEPYVLVAVNILAAASAEEAWREHTSLRQMLRAMLGGERHPVQPPVEPDSLAPNDAEESMLRFSAVGTPDDVAASLQRIAERTGADELLGMTTSFDPAVREESLRLTAQAWMD